MNKIRILTVILSVTSLLSFSYTLYLINQRNRQIKFSYYNFNTGTTVSSEIMPVSIEIPAINVSLPVIQTSITNHEWEVTSDGIAYLKDTVLPGDEGNSVFYGHNWPNLLKNLNDIKNGDEISIKLSNGDIRKFIIKDKFVVTPDQTHILNDREGKILTLYTCTGFMDSKRLVVVAEFI